MTTKAIRCMRKVGGFDNYILLTKPKNLDSIYGEYLRILMLKKLNNPEFDVPYIAKSRDRQKGIGSKKHSRYKKLPVVWLPKELRHRDLSDLTLRAPDEMTRKEAKREEELIHLVRNMQDIETNHPIVKEVMAEHEEQLRLLEPIKQEALARWARFKNKKGRIKAEKLCQEEEAEYMKMKYLVSEKE